jgi:hypothetical protein
MTRVRIIVVPMGRKKNAPFAWISGQKKKENK